MAENEMILFSEQDIEQLKLLSGSELQSTIEQMIMLGKRVSDNYSFLETAPWYKRALATISGKTKRTQREIATDQAIISMYCVQIVGEFVNRGIITQNRVTELENKVNEIYQQFTRLAQATGNAVNAMDDYTTLSLGVLSGYYSDSLISAIHIGNMLSRIDVRSEKFNVMIGAIRKNIVSKPVLTEQRLLEISKASANDMRYYYEYAENGTGKFAKTVKLCLNLIEAKCFDETGAQKALNSSGFTNKEMTFDEFVTKIILANQSM